MGRVDILAPIGLTILTIGIIFTVGLPLTMILKRKKDKVIITDYFFDQ